MPNIRRVLGIAALVAIMIVLPALPALAADVVVTLAPGQSVTVPLDLWCLNYGKPFPTAVEGPTARPPDEVVKVMQTALAKGTVTSDVYQTQLAIWRATTGEYKDFANQGSDLAQEIYEASLNATIAPLPAGAISVEEGVKAGTLKVTMTDFTPMPVEGIPGHPFHGQANLIIENISAETVKVVLVEGAVFTPAGGEDAQALISHQNPVTPPVLPPTGGAWWHMPQFAVAAALGAGIALMLAGRRTPYKHQEITQ